MRRFLLISAALFSTFILVLLFIGSQLDRAWHAEAQKTVDASPDEVYAFISNMDNWHKWAGWTDEDQQEIEITREGPAHGVGATISWNADGSTGRLTIIKADPNKGIWYEAAMDTDEVTATGSVTFKEQDGKTVIMWEDEGELPPIIGGYFRAYINEQLSAHYETSLNRLKTELEKSTPVTPEKTDKSYPDIEPLREMPRKELGK